MNMYQQLMNMHWRLNTSLQLRPTWIEHVLERVSPAEEFPEHFERIPELGMVEARVIPAEIKVRGPATTTAPTTTSLFRRAEPIVVRPLVFYKK